MALARLPVTDHVGRFVRALVRALARLTLAAVAGVAILALTLARGGYDTAELVLTLLLLIAPALVLVLLLGLRALLELPERLRGLPQRGSEQMTELTRLAGDARSRGWRHTPFLLWRLRGLVSSSRDLVGIALPLRVFAPPFLALALAAVVASAILVGVGLVALVVLAVS